jgi:hypothetical protein
MATLRLNELMELSYVLLLFPAPPAIMIDKKFQDKLTIKAGSSAIVEVPFTGSPMPQVTWTYNDKDLPDYKRTKDETIHGMTALTLSRLERKDSGTYKCLIENKHGSVTLGVHVTVLGEFCSLLFYFLRKFQQMYVFPKIPLCFKFRIILLFKGGRRSLVVRCWTHDREVVN